MHTIYAYYNVLLVLADASFVGTVEKDAATLAEEHKELFTAANKKELEKRVRHFYKITVFSSLLVDY